MVVPDVVQMDTVVWCGEMCLEDEGRLGETGRLYITVMRCLVSFEGRGLRVRDGLQIIRIRDKNMIRRRSPETPPIHNEQWKRQRERWRLT